VEKVEFERDKLNNKVSGTRKRGSLWLERDTIICKIRTSDGKQHPVLSGIRGHLMEINDRLIGHPSLLVKSPSTTGYIAIIRPKHKEQDAVCSVSLSRSQYEALRFPPSQLMMDTAPAISPI